jgi:uncharacterized alkaline shock family protein YloU
MSPVDDCRRRIEDLSDYLDTGSSPDAEHIDHCPQCQARLAGLRSLNEAALDLMADDVEEAGTADTSWLDNILANLLLETRAGRSIPVSGDDPLDELTETEGAVVSMIRAVGDSLDGVLIGKCRLHGDITLPGAPVTVDVNVSARYGHPLPDMAQKLRREITAALAVHTEMVIEEVNITVVDIRPPRDEDTAEGNADDH